MEGAPRPSGFEGKYDRDAIVGRLEALTGNARKQFEADLTRVGYGLDQVQEWMHNPSLLEDADVEVFARELAEALAELTMAAQTFDYEGSGKNDVNMNTFKEASRKAVGIIVEKFED